MLIVKENHCYSFSD